jgi:hypothetical protein
MHLYGILICAKFMALNIEISIQWIHKITSVSNFIFSIVTWKGQNWLILHIKCHRNETDVWYVLNNFKNSLVWIQWSTTYLKYWEAGYFRYKEFSDTRELTIGASKNINKWQKNTYVTYITCQKKSSTLDVHSNHHWSHSLEQKLWTVPMVKDVSCFWSWLWC